MTHVFGRRSPLLAATAAGAILAVVGTAVPAARADAYSPQPTNPSATTDAGGWHRLSTEGSIYRFAAGGNTVPGSFAVTRGTTGTEVVVATCFDSGSYVIPGAAYRARFYLQNWNSYGTNLRYEIRRGLGSSFAVLLPSQPMAAGDVFTEIVSPTFVADAGARPCISFSGGAWPAGASWDAFALDDVHLEVVSYPVPSAEVLPQVTATGAVQEGQTLTHVPATWSIRAPYPLTRSAEFQRCNAMGGACEAIGSGPVGSKHLLSAADAGRTIRVLETAVNDEGEAQSVLSAATAVVQALPKPEPAEPPVVRPGAGHTLTVDVRWPQGATLGYQWFRCEADRTGCAPIPGATGPVYALTTSDAGRYVFVRMTATTSGGATTIDSGYTVPSLSGAFPPTAIGPVPPVPGAPVPPSSVGRRVTLSASVNRVRAVVGTPVVVSGTLTGVPIGTRVSLTLANAQWKRHARRYTVRTRSGGRFRATVRPVVSAQVEVVFAGTSAHRAATVSTRRIHVTPSIGVRITASPDGPGQVRNLRIRGRFSPGFGQGARLQLEGRPAGGRTWYSFCTRVAVGRGGLITGACNVGRLHATNQYRLVYVAQAGSPWTTAASRPTRARITR